MQTLTPTPLVGDAAIDFALPTPVGGAERLSDLQGTVVIVAFHPPHWDPARQAQVHAHVSIAGQAHSASNTLLIRNDGETAAAYGVRDASAVFVVDADGTIAWRHITGVDTLQPVVSLRAPVTDASLGAEASGEWSRREFLVAATAAAIAVALEPALKRADAAAQRAAATAPGAAVPVSLNVNGKTISLSLEPRVTLLDALREYAGLTGSKKGCDHGQCGACTVHIDGRRTLSCLTFAVMQQNKPITTIEGLATAAGRDLHPMQEAFIEHDGFQCGYCTSGQIMSAVAMTREPWGPTDDDVREAMSGNICRCGAYPGIVAAVQNVRRGNGGAPR